MMDLTQWIQHYINQQYGGYRDNAGQWQSQPYQFNGDFQWGVDPSMDRALLGGAMANGIEYAPLARATGTDLNAIMAAAQGFSPDRLAAAGRTWLADGNPGNPSLVQDRTKHTTPFGNPVNSTPWTPSGRTNPNTMGRPNEFHGPRRMSSLGDVMSQQRNTWNQSRWGQQAGGQQNRIFQSGFTSRSNGGF